MHKLLQPFNLIFLIVLMAGISPHSVFAQQTDPIGGPYETDSATVLLMHFDRDFNNDNADHFQVEDPEIFGNISFLNMDGAGNLNQQVRFDNDSESDKSHIQIPDTTALDLTGSWTMEMWVNIFTFGTTQEDWRRQPRLYFKPGDPDEAAYWQSNYAFNIFGQNRDFAVTYWSEAIQDHINIRSPNNIMRIGEWYHLTFIRDTVKQVIVQMIHQNAVDKGRLPNANDDSLELIQFDTEEYSDEASLPRISDQPLFIATSPQNDTAFANLDGFMDEVRISNTVRNFPVPPVISDVTELGNQRSDLDYEISAKLETLGDAQIGTADLNYRVNAGSWQTTALAQDSGNYYSATIPSQDVGTSVEYWIEAETESGLRSTQPPRAQMDTSYYSFAVWTDSTTVFSLDFDQGDDVPEDQSQFNADVTLNGANETVTYARGDDGDSDQAMVFTAADETWLSTDSPVHQLTNFALDFKFYAQDSVPGEGTRFFAKGTAGDPHFSNYQVYMEDGVAKPAIYAPDNNLDPCGSFTGGCLKLTDHPIEVETWYHVQMGIYGPEVAEDSTGRIFSRIMDAATGDTLSERLHPVDGGAFNNSAALKIGGVGDADESPFFNGRIDDFTVYNYVPEGYADTTTITSVDEPAELPRKVTLDKNYPNPFNPTTRIDFSLPKASDIELTVYDVLGRHVATLIDGKRQAGTYSVSFDAGNFSSGVYLYRLKTENRTLSRKMLLLK